METQEPRESIHAKDVKTRAAAARDLARIGGWDDLELLVGKATGDKSSAVRLYTAAAASDILSRFRGLPGQQALTREQREQVHAWVRGTDPGVNPGMLMMLSAVADRAAVDRLGRMLRDPRNGVRAGAAAAIRRMVLSAAGQDDAYVRRQIGEWLDDRRVPPDAKLELIKIAGEAGFSDLADAVRAAASAGRPHVAASDEALARLRARTEPASWQGLWVDEGLDVLEVAASAREGSSRIVWDARIAGPDGVVDASLDGDRLHAGDVSFRLLYAPRPGESEARPALQDDARTFWRVEDKALAGVVEESGGLPDAPAEALGAVAGWLADVEGVVAARARAIALWRSGALDDALAALTALADAKKPRADVFWWLGRVRAQAGDAAGAVEALDRFLDKAGKKARYRKEAEALRAELG